MTPPTNTKNMIYIFSFVIVEPKQEYLMHKFPFHPLRNLSKHKALGESAST